MSDIKVGDECTLCHPIVTQLGTMIPIGTKCKVAEVWPSGHQFTIKTEAAETIYNVEGSKLLRVS